ncbi:DUF2778 domain-containing protein [Methylobacterium sp. Leaf88]|uniref:DUF2778 domain-containing protein n=1 Tax=Methylobacterium sp. Leaf88 TaxID=1736244 RepID=UPI001FCD5F2D|nr:DUF2778 domain-containing protein [Methylobacterium sp. Leaf88]
MAEAAERSMSTRPGRAARGLGLAALLLGGGIAGFVAWSRPPAAIPTIAAVTPVDPPAAAPVGADRSADSAAATSVDPAPEVPAPVAPEVPAPASVAEATTATPEAAPETAPTAMAEPATAQPPLVARWVPLPVPRPPEFRAGRLSARSTRAAPARTASAAPPPEDTRSFIEKLFGVESSEPPRLAYAALETKPVDDVFRRALSAVPTSPTGGVAVYDIRAKVVILPNGEKLEAHSGLGESMDNPGHTHVRMRGPTPLGTYDIREREQPFHGVRALRLTPVGGPEAIHGRVGLLAHTYMLGASGASNGCVSFRDYDKFLQAYLRGEVQRLVVVAGG